MHALLNYLSYSIFEKKRKKERKKERKKNPTNPDSHSLTYSLTCTTIVLYHTLKEKSRKGRKRRRGRKKVLGVGNEVEWSREWNGMEYILERIYYPPYLPTLLIYRAGNPYVYTCMHALLHLKVVRWGGSVMEIVHAITIETEMVDRKIERWIDGYVRTDAKGKEKQGRRVRKKKEKKGEEKNPRMCYRRYN